eukprot:CAMPEP_0203667778 /NCGR_PEP_ID=MMETSP0090-20130426/4550_1 /ASSEMBLY_ACC=CAM_ASM_001088 /TAXON_ID=426623 /ORGANISM="Chaetoceros affinis, Strain CCMP159" /LENGTH=434 /DNA_ID=CAMNT_0050532045 /DNA_START=45 /DNA_END=1346 /DNA_ORIENTATION=-
MAAAGIYLHCLGIANDDSKKLLAKISQQVTIPALLFTKIVYCKQDSSTEDCPSIFDLLINSSAWMILFWPIYVVGCGLLVGHLVARVSNTPRHHRELVLASCAFANSTGLPITLLSVIHQNFPPSTELGKIDPTLFLSMYLLLYPVLQWGVGGWLLMDGDNSDPDHTRINSNTNANANTIRTSGSDQVDDQDTALTELDLAMETSNSTSSDPEKLTLIESYHEQKIFQICTKKCANCVTVHDDNDILRQANNGDEMQQSHRIRSHSILWGQLRQGFRKSLQPPVVGSLLGLFIVSFRSLRGIVVDMEDRNDNAPMEFIFDGLYSIGQAAVPINMMILGINLSKTMQTKPNPQDILSPQSTFAVIFAKMVVMPIIGIFSALFLKHFVWNIPDDIDDAFYLVLMIVFITPTANNIMIMVELGDKVSKEGISRLLGW